MDDAELSSQIRRSFSRYPFAPGREPGARPADARRGRSIALSFGLVGVAAIGLWLASATPLNPRPSVTFAGWTSTPSAPDLSLAASGSAACNVDPSMNLVAQDQRGNAAALLYRGGDQLAICLVVRDSAGSVVATTTGFTRLAEFGGALSVDTILSAPPAGQDPGIRIVAGRVSAHATRVDLAREDGTSVGATVRAGSFLAWWPTDDDATEAVAKDSHGATLARVQPEN